MPMASRRFYASVGNQANHDDFLLAMALELMVEIGVREAAGSPVFRRNDIARMHLEIVMQRTAPRAFGKDLVPCSLKLIRRRILPVLEIARLRAVMKHMENGNIGLACRTHDVTKVVEQINFLGNVFDPRPEFAAFAEEVVVMIDAQHGCNVGFVGGCLYLLAFKIRHRMFLINIGWLN